MSSSSSSGSYGLSFDTYGRYTQRGRQGQIKAKDEREHKGRLKWQAKKSIKWDIKKIHEDSPNCPPEKLKRLVNYRIQNHILKYKEALKILANNEQYERLRAEALALPYVSYRPPSPESAGSHFSGQPAPPVYIDISLDSEDEEDPEEPQSD
ncbi:hypothetical protein RHGRI_020648 [Rhododendron griersonianum]|uniref:Uncharacterized protein n=1 Tax=Rhododendron griersonianum TaxID=479676 RepID=A0AAV6JJ45_9ERIC|nr:hypothetical protein RHGRI_020648 [Rhododendron griersonianum]